MLFCYLYWYPLASVFHFIAYYFLPLLLRITGLCSSRCECGGAQELHHQPRRQSTRHHHGVGQVLVREQGRVGADQRSVHGCRGGRNGAGQGHERAGRGGGGLSADSSTKTRIRQSCHEEKQFGALLLLSYYCACIRILLLTELDYLVEFLHIFYSLP